MAQEVTLEIEGKAQPDAVPEADRLSPPSSGSPRSFDKPSAKPGARTKILLGLAALLFVTVALAAGYYFFMGWESTDDAQIDGYVNPISSRVAGYITKVYAEDNQYVKAGTLLAQIDATDYEVALASAQATLANDRATADASQVNVPITSVNTASEMASAQADVDNSRAGISASQKGLAAARAALLQAEANNAKAQDDVKRYKPLVDRQEIPEQLYVQAVQTANATAAAVEVAAANVQADQDAVTQAQGNFDQAVAALESARTGPQQVRIQQSRALAAAALADKSRDAVQQAQLNLNYTRIMAPVDGLIAKRSVQVGQYVVPGQQLLAVVPLDDIWVTANFKETQLRNVRPGEPVAIYVDAYGRDYSGHVESIAGGTGAIFSLLPPENATGNYVKVVQRVPVRLRFDPGQDPDHRLRPGLSVEPKVNVKWPNRIDQAER
ncbi:MAG: HlyD family secretion protein [Acidobacteria bacterium]|nr:MAG: HlyD family secretion protein [Acidobacteriota bacterium]